MSNKIPPAILSKIKRYPLFYQKVWLECAKISRGETLSYGELAKKAGSPGAARAVGTALSKNPFAPVIPCHRVIAANGKPGGYSGRGGIKKKISLLKREGAI
ncbi:MAG TPA: hypothetical protein DEE98_07910 [Elusimicrobia bacterium]|nr:MAG: hypothetical protein A2278_00745 [Elusimicrobia bacterium RIFOXYA12_FULL_49_49]OGS15184.1 MAG: hypothetical protein A2251_00755 [Elusimicrobia bacterium RIFOXYA2_FULL_47_53]OGS26946.1 MAG: hypothetical protein A2339_01435 [Elusimicrobia bacterium RIFOXYB12_FULL_50_12]OGS29804.1 MAG: hypothetical protein A2323_01555 [Elusimicrobia bacterium RIFOXYB2_FULL_46_23]HBU70287.1 hypothetical protein [Elusimicrobiota bacterium]